MSVLVPSLTNNHHHHAHHHSPYYPTVNNAHPPRRHHTNKGTAKSSSSSSSSMKTNDNESEGDHVPFGVVNSMKQRFLSKVNESYVFNQTTNSIARPPLSKNSSRLSSNENLLQTKNLPSPLKRTTRLSRSQDNLSNPPPLPSISGQTNIVEPYTSYLQPKHELIIVDALTKSNHNQENENDHFTDDDLDDGKLRTGQKSSAHRHSYTELHHDEAPKPGTVTTVKNMFERQIRLSRYDADKIFVNNTPGSSRMSSQHRDVSSPIRSRSMSPNDMALRQRRAIIPPTNLSSTSTALSLPVATPYPDLVISHTPPTEPTKNSTETILINSHVDALPSTNVTFVKEKKPVVPARNSATHETQLPLSVIVDDPLEKPINHQRPNLLLPSKSSESVDCEPLDFKSRLALFNRTNGQPTQDHSIPHKKPSTALGTTTSTTITGTINSSIHQPPSKPIVHHPVRPMIEEKNDSHIETITNLPLSVSIARSVINPAKAVTFFGGNKLNGNNKSSLPNSIAAPLPSKVETTSNSKSMDLFRSPDVVGGNVKLTKSSIFSGTRKEVRVQFIESVDTFEYPSFEVAMAELGGTGSDDDHNPADEDDDDDEQSTGSSGNGDDNLQMKSVESDQFLQFNIHQDDVDDDELERLARINAKFNSNHETEQALKPKGTLHTFRPTHLDQYELGTQHGSISTIKSSDSSSTTHSYSQLARQKLFTSTENASAKNFPQHSFVKQQKANFDLSTNIQWSSMSTTTDLLF